MKNLKPKPAFIRRQKISAIKPASIRKGGEVEGGVFQASLTKAFHLNMGEAGRSVGLTRRGEEREASIFLMQIRIRRTREPAGGARRERERAKLTRE